MFDFQTYGGNVALIEERIERPLLVALVAIVVAWSTAFLIALG